MTTSPNARNTPPRPRESEFDLVEDLSAEDGAGDATDFGRALDDILPEAGGPGVDIDLDDFEAFNRELDAQIEGTQGSGGNAVEDLGTEVVEAASQPPPDAEHEWDDTTEEPVMEARPDEAEPELAEDVVTLGAAPATAPTAVPAARAAASEPAVAPAVAEAPPDEPRGSRAGTIGMLLGLAGLAAGGAALWLTMERQAELERINATLAVRSPVVQAEPAAAPVATANADAIRALDTRINTLREQIASLEAKTAHAVQSAVPAEALDQRLAELETEIAALQQEPPPAPEAGPPAPVAAPSAAHQTTAAETPKPTTAAPAPKAAEPEAKQPAVPTAAADAKPAAAKPAEPKAAEQPATPPKPARRPLAMPDEGPWVVVVQSFSNEEAAERRRAQVAETGLPAEVRWVRVKDQIWHRVIVPGYASQGSAQAAAAELGRRKLGSPWVLLLERPE